MLFLRAVQFWILVSTLASVAGWTLSATGILNKTGYAIFAGVVMVTAFVCRKSALFSPVPWVQSVGKLRRRFRRLLPAGFGILAALVFISGCLYAPTDHMGLSYRLPRVLQWLQHGHWFWIHTPNYRMNDRACGIEWLTAPFLLFLKSDRALFLLNFIPFILMPGLIFSIWIRLGVRPRVAWNWMWLVPTGYCFLLQAGGIANDAFPTVYLLAMMDFVLRAREKCRGTSVESRGPGDAGPILRRSPGEGRWTLDLGLSVLSAALLVGAKASNLPLGLPWIIVVIPLLPRLLSFGSPQHTKSTVLRWSFLLVIALVISFIPTAILNIHYIHDWSGLSIEHTGMDMKNPVAGILGNSLLFVTNNFVPTFFPMAHWWNDHAASFFPGALMRMMDANFEQGYMYLGEMPTEDWAGIGFGVSVLLAMSIVAGWWTARNTQHAARHVSRFTFLLLFASWVSLLAYCVKTGMVTPARLITPYYPLLLPLLLIGAGQSQVVRRRWWKGSTIVVLLLALAALVVTPARPLFPVKTILAKLVAKHPNQSQLLRAQNVYEVYGRRADPLAGLRESLPKNLQLVGFMGTCDDLDISLYKPYGSRRVEPFLLEDSPEQIRRLGVEYAVIGGYNLAYSTNGITLDEWLKKSNAELLATTNVMVTLSQGVQPWYLVRLKP